MKNAISLFKSDTGSFNRLPWQHQFSYLFLVIIILSIFVFPRFLHLDADPSPDFIPGDIGYQIDEGYKTLAAKNLLVFGDTSWHPYDTYNGWMNSSPVTQWPYYYAFKTLGLELKSARLVSAFYFVLFIALAFYFLYRRYALAIALAGILLLASDPALFYFSRSALFETALILFVYASLLFITRIDPDKQLKAVSVMILIMFVAMFTVKLTAVIYYLPPIAACCFLVVSNMERWSWSWSWKKTLYSLVLLLTVLLFLYSIQNLLPKINMSSMLRFPKFFLLNPMPKLTPLALILGYSCILHLLLVRPKYIYNNIYRLSLVSVVVVGPIILSLVAKHPPRYFVPIIPACLLLTVEWLHLKPWKLRIQDSFTGFQKFTIAVFLLLYTMLWLRAFDVLILRNLPFSIDVFRGIDNLLLVVLLMLFTVVIFGFYYMVRRNAVRMLGFSIPLLALASVITGVSVQTVALTHPSYKSQTIRTALNDIVSGTESIAGDWAPFFTAEAPIRSFYMSERSNFPYPEHLENIRPDYFLSSNTPYEINVKAALEGNDQIQLGEPQMIGSYLIQDINIYRIKYLNSK